MLINCSIGTDTPLWRIGPPEKPVLCNACGSRWRIWGNLDDYTPKHGFTFISTRNRCTRSREQGKLPSHQSLFVESQNMELKFVTCSAGLEDNEGNGSESGSALPSSDSCIQSENINKTETSGNKQHT